MRKVFIASDTGKIFVCDTTGQSNVLVPHTSFKVDEATSADSATSATSATYATSAGTANSATSATNASSATYATSAGADGNGDTISTTYAKLDSPVFTGTPESVTPSTSDDSTRIATTAFVNSAITVAIGSIAGISIQIVEQLPDTGQSNVFYLIRNASQTGSNLYDEYIWIASTQTFESLGPISIDLTGYINSVQVSGSGNAVTGYSLSGSTLTLEKNSTFLTEHPTIPTNSNTTSTAEPAAGSTFTAIDGITKDSNGHVTSYNTKTVTLPTSVTYATSAGSATNASTATYATNAGTATYASTAANATSATNAGTATYATSAGSATSATNASSATYATSAGSADTASTSTYSSYIISGSTANRIPYYGCGNTTANPASTATADCFNFDFGDIDSNNYYF
jgi:hypothetical protein